MKEEIAKEMDNKFTYIDGEIEEWKELASYILQRERVLLDEIFKALNGDCNVEQCWDDAMMIVQQKLKERE